MQIQTWHPPLWLCTHATPLWLCTHAKYYVKSGLTNVLKNANKTKNMHLFSIRKSNYKNIRICVDPNPLRVERQDPDNFPRLQTRERCALEIAAYVFKHEIYLRNILELLILRSGILFTREEASDVANLLCFKTLLSRN